VTQLQQFESGFCSPGPHAHTLHRRWLLGMALPDRTSSHSHHLPHTTNTHSPDRHLNYMQQFLFSFTFFLPLGPPSLPHVPHHCFAIHCCHQGTSMLHLGGPMSANELVGATEEEISIHNTVCRRKLYFGCPPASRVMVVSMHLHERPRSSCGRRSTDRWNVRSAMLLKPSSGPGSGTLIQVRLCGQELSHPIMHLTYPIALKSVSGPSSGY
jgi:hypothetical protein